MVGKKASGKTWPEENKKRIADNSKIVQNSKKQEDEKVGYEPENAKFRTAIEKAHKEEED